MMDGAQEHVSRRSFLRGALASDTSQGWFSVEGLPTSGTAVFWDGWADEAGVLLVGDDGLIVQFDGDSWTTMSSPVPVPIHALGGTDRRNIWAVGWMGLLMRFDGTDWHKIRGCVVDGAGKYASVPENTPLFDLCTTADGRAWAVGDRGTILQYNGADWQPEPSGTHAHLRSVAQLADGRMLAAGADGTVVVKAPETSWTALDCQIASTFTGIYPLEDGGALLFGGRYFIDANGFRGDVVHWDGSGFHRVFTDRQFSRFRAVGQTSQGLIALGDAGQIHLFRGDRVDRLETGTGHDLLGLARLPSGEALAVGDFGTILVGDAEALTCYAPSVSTGGETANWQPMASGTDRQLWGIWHDDQDGTLYACGEEGTILCLDRGSWEALPPAGALGIHDLARAPDGGLLACGQLGEIHHFDGQTWRKHFDLHMDVTILSLWSDKAGTIFAAGDEGLVLRWTGQDWERMPSGTKSALYGLWGTDAEHLLAVGDFGQVMRWNGQRWDEFSAGTEHFLFDVWGRALNDIFVVGLSGTIGHFDGTCWQITPARARNDLLAITGTGTDAVAVGAAGAAAMFDGHRWHMDPTGTDAGLRAVSVDAAGRYHAVGDGGMILTRDLP